MNTTDKYIACPEHHSGITRVRINQDYVAPLPHRFGTSGWFCALMALSPPAMLLLWWVLS